MKLMQQNFPDAEGAAHGMECASDQRQTSMAPRTLRPPPLLSTSLCEKTQQVEAEAACRPRKCQSSKRIPRLVLQIARQKPVPRAKLRLPWALRSHSGRKRLEQKNPNGSKELS